MIKPDVYTSIGKIINRIESEGFTINKLKMTKLTVEDARGFYAEHEVKQFEIELMNIRSGKRIL
jgi:nucleoside-diphosphate kinase